MQLPHVAYDRPTAPPMRKCLQCTYQNHIAIVMLFIVQVYKQLHCVLGASVRAIGRQVHGALH